MVMLEGEKGKALKAKAMIDSGAEGIFLDQKFVQKYQVPSRKLL